MKYSSKKWFKDKIHPLLIIGLLVVAGAGVYIYTQNKSTGSYSQTSTSTLPDISSRSVNEFFPNSIDNHSIATLFSEKETGGKQYKVIIEDVPNLQTKGLDTKAELSDRYYAAYGDPLADNPNDVSELFYNKLRTVEDVAKVEKILEYQYKNSMLPGYSLSSKFISGIKAWIVTTPDKNKRDFITLLFKNNRILIDITVGTNSKNSTENIVRTYINFIINQKTGSFVNIDNVLNDKLEAFSLDQKRHKFIQSLQDKLNKK